MLKLKKPTELNKFTKQDFQKKLCKKGLGGWKKEELLKICQDLGIKITSKDKSSKELLCERINNYFNKNVNGNKSGGGLNASESSSNVSKSLPGSVNVSVSLPNLFIDNSVDDIESLDEFIRYVLYDCSNCVEDFKIDEIGKSKLYKDYKNKGVCKEIRMEELSDEFKKKFRGNDQRYMKTLLAQKTIDLFVKRGLLKKRGNVYYLLNTNRRLSWNNIKQLKIHHLNDLNNEVRSEIFEIFGKEYDLLTLVKVLFWYFRKAIVDSILYDIIKRAKGIYNTDDIVALSVGSTKLTSDYDISVDSLYEICGYVIKKFVKVIENIFNDDSEGLFDTNVYGVSFTKSKRDKKDVFKMEHKCKGDEKTTVNYISIEGSLDMDVSQMIWSYVKLLLKMSFILKQDDKLYEKMYSYLEDKLENNIFFDKALGFVNMYRSNVDNYKNVVDKYDEYMSRNSKIGKDDYLTSNFISFVNYNGSETYLTSGAFLDVVINQQLCLNKDQINLSKPYMYFISFIENMSDLLTHYHKTKYTTRSEKALINMEKLLQNDPDVNVVVISEIKDILKWIGITQKKCVDDIYKCQVFDLMYTITYSIVKVSDMFYDYIIKKFGKDAIAKSANLFSKLEFPEVVKQDALSIIESESPKK